MPKAADVSAALDTCNRQVLIYLFPAGRFAGHEFVVGSLNGEKGDSLKVALNGKGSVWADFATGDSGGDLLDLWAQARCGGDVAAAMSEAVTWLGIHPDTRTRKSGDAKAHTPPPDAHPTRGKPDAKYEYTDAEGHTIGWVYRWEARGDEKKQFAQLTLRNGVWKWQGFDKPLPLYRQADLASRPDAPVLVVEGEKAADGAVLLDFDYVVVSWPGGTNAVGHVDLSPLRHRSCVLWPDNDTPGRKAMNALAQQLKQSGAEHVTIVQPPDMFPDEWDLGDPLPEGTTVDQLKDLIAEAQAERVVASGLGEWDAGTDVAPIPPRGWLLGNVFCRRFVSSLIADGGVGKTAVRIAQFLALAAGRALTGEHVFQRCRVLIISLEDDADELRRRVLAAMRHHGVSRDEVAGWLFLAAPGAAAGKLAILDDKGRPAESTLAVALRQTIAHRKLDVVSLDPFVKSHAVEENGNNAIDAVMQILADCASQFDCAIDVPHHMAKGVADPGNASRGRGASAMKDAARLVYTLTPMSPDEAKAYGVPESDRRRLIRMDSGKVNIAPPVVEAKWFRLVGVPLRNGTDLYPHGDEVQTVEVWTPPNILEGINNTIANAILTDLEAGLPDGNRYSNHHNAADRAAWRIVTKHVPDKAEGPARQIIAAWIRNGVLVCRDYDNPTRRKPAQGLFVDPAKRPS